MPYTVNPDFGYLEYRDGGGSQADVQEFDVDTGSNVEPLLGIVGVTGTSIFSSGAVANTLTLNTQSTLNTFLVGAGSLSTMTELGPLTNGQLIIGSTGATPVAGSITSTDGSLTVTGGAGTLDITVTGGASFTTGSVIFWGGSAFEEDNSNFFWDDTNNRLGIGTAVPSDTLHVVGDIELSHTATVSDDHAMELDVFAAGFGDVKAIDIVYRTGALAAGSEDAIILINIDETLATGGEVFGLEVLTTTEGSDVIGGLKTGIGVDAVTQEAGTFGDLDEILNIAVDVTAALANGGAGNIVMFAADDDTITMGDAAIWDELEIIVQIGASGGGISPVFAFSTGGAGFTNFVPVDGTNGFKNTGIIDWNSGDLSGWATNASGRYEIRITRTKNSLTTNPTVDEIQRGAETTFKWDKSGDVNLNSLTLVTDLAVAHGGTGVSTLTDGGVMLGSGTAAVTVLGQATNGQLVIGSTGADPVLGSILSADASVVITAGAGSIDLAVNDLIKTNDTNGLGAHNLGLFLSVGVSTIKGADGNDLSASNPGYVTIRSNVTEGNLVTYEMTANFTFNDVAAGSSMFAGSLFGMTTGDTTTGETETNLYLYAVADDNDANLSFMCTRYPNQPLSVADSVSSTFADGASGNADKYTDSLMLETVGGSLSTYDLNQTTCIGMFRTHINGSDDWAVQSMSSVTGIGRMGSFENLAHSQGIMGQSSSSYFLANSGTAPTDGDTNPFQYRISQYDQTINLYVDITFTGSPAGAVDAIINMPMMGPNSTKLCEIDGTLIIGGAYNKVILRQVGGTVNTTARQFYLYKGNGTTARWQYEEFASGDRLLIQDSIMLR